MSALRAGVVFFPGSNGLASAAPRTAWWERLGHLSDEPVRGLPLPPSRSEAREAGGRGGAECVGVRVGVADAVVPHAVASPATRYWPTQACTSRTLERCLFRPWRPHALECVWTHAPLLPRTKSRGACFSCNDSVHDEVPVEALVKMPLLAALLIPVYMAARANNRYMLVAPSRSPA